VSHGPSEIILICCFGGQEIVVIIIMLKTVLLFNTFVETVMIFFDEYKVL